MPLPWPQATTGAFSLSEYRTAIPVHHTATSEAAWDAGSMMQRCSGAANLRAMCAWMDQAGDPESKSSYKFPHHEVADNGDVGPANLAACSAGIAALNGGRGGSSIPESDRRGVYNHLATHMRDADREPTALRSPLLDVEQRRAFPITELRVDDSGDQPRITGYAAVFEQLSEPLGMLGLNFREKIAKGAFDKVLKSKPDVRALFNHDPNHVIGRTTAGTLRLAEDSKGLSVEIDPPDTTFARDLMVSMKRGDISQMSFGFTVEKDTWEEGNKGEQTRTINVVRRLVDVSPVAFPAYTQTSVTARSLGWALDMDGEAFLTALERAAGEPEPERRDILTIRAAAKALIEMYPDPDAALESLAATSEERKIVKLGLYRAKARLAQII